MRALISILLLLIAVPSQGATLRVERDGSGDFTTIQAAIDAASPGDLILLGPGRYTEVTTVVSGSVTFRIYAYVAVDGLTFRGVDRDAVIIGPETGPPQIARIGFAEEGIQTITVENLRLENLYDGLGVAGEHVRVRGCLFMGCDAGVASHALFETLVEDCEFSGMLDSGVLVFRSLGSTGVLIQNCLFEDGSIGIDLQTEGNVVQRCTFRNTVVGLQFSFAATGSILGCTFENNSHEGIVLTDGSTCTLLNNEVYARDGAVCLGAYGGSYGSGVANLFEGGSYATILLSDASILDLSQGHILGSGTAPCVWTQSGQGDGHIIDLRNNYWGTNDAAEIEGCIIDSHDAPQLTGTVLFEPFLTDPVAAQERTFSSLKALFSPDH